MQHASRPPEDDPGGGGDGSQTESLLGSKARAMGSRYERLDRSRVAPRGGVNAVPRPAHAQSTLRACRTRCTLAPGTQRRAGWGGCVGTGWGAGIQRHEHRERGAGETRRIPGVRAATVQVRARRLAPSVCGRRSPDRQSRQVVHAQRRMPDYIMLPEGQARTV
jgi:hypothetical protein